MKKIDVDHVGALKRPGGKLMPEMQGCVWMQCYPGLSLYEALLKLLKAEKAKPYITLHSGGHWRRRQRGKRHESAAPSPPHTPPAHWRNGAERANWAIKHWRSIGAAMAQWRRQGGVILIFKAVPR